MRAFSNMWPLLVNPLDLLYVLQNWSYYRSKFYIVGIGIFLPFLLL